MEESEKLQKVGTETGGGRRPPGTTRIGAGAGDSDFSGGSYGLSRFWTNYKRILKESFDRMSPAEQKDLIIKAKITGFAFAAIMILSLYFLLSR